MTSFTDRARAEAYRLMESGCDMSMTFSETFIAAAEWAAEQDPTEEEVEAAATSASEAIDTDVRLLVLSSGVTLATFQEQLPGIRDALAARAARAVLLAARDVRKEQER